VHLQKKGYWQVDKTDSISSGTRFVGFLTILHEWPNTSVCFKNLDFIIEAWRNVGQAKRKNKAINLALPDDFWGGNFENSSGFGRGEWLSPLLAFTSGLSLLKFCVPHPWISIVFDIIWRYLKISFFISNNIVRGNYACQTDVPDMRYLIDAIWYWS